MDIFAQERLKVKLKEEALSLGFSDMRVCTVEDFSAEDAERLKLWIDCGMSAGMSYLARSLETKIRPRKFFAEANSAIVLSANFYRPSRERRIALYAQGADYHDVIGRKLLPLCKILEDAGGRQKCSVDASPLWEKAFAVRAGIGWRGRNTLIIRRDNGPWSFLGLILTSVKLPADSPVENCCASCMKCVDACPTSALGKMGLDANKCVSYLTIEKKGVLSGDEMRMAGDKIFGCDICLRVCPFGAGAPLAEIPEFQSELKISDAPTKDELRLVARGTPMGRRFK